MEYESPQFLSGEQQENIQFYKDWVRNALLEGIADIDPLLRYRERLTLDRYDEAFFHSKGLDAAPLLAVGAMLDDAIREEIDGAVRDIQRNVFEAHLFRVGIEIDGDVVIIDGVTGDGAVILPVIGGEPYAGPFDDVRFDR